MKTYNRALDFTVLALSELKKGNGALAARLMAKAVQEPDLNAAIATLEASNKHAFSLKAKKAVASRGRLRASDEFPFDESAEEEVAADDMDMDDPLEEVADFDEDSEYSDDSETPGQEMAKVLSKMVRRSGRK